jgi:hypothetical protein
VYRIVGQVCCIAWGLDHVPKNNQQMN